MDKSLLFCAFPCAHYAGRTPRRVGMGKSLLSCAFPCAHYAGRTTRRVGMDKSLLFCAVTCAHYAGRTKRGELERKKDGNIQRRGCPEKAGAMGAQVRDLRPYPSKIQRYKENIRKENKIRKIFIEKLYSSFMAKSPYLYAFIIRIYSQLQHQLHKQLDVTRHKTIFRIYVTINRRASV